jgi:MerR family Zn(II)-responsive transcriptional regulator of zntA
MQQIATIGDASRLTGVPVRTIRFYEQAGLLPATDRTDSGYRLFGPTELRRLRLIRRARIVGLSLPQVRELADAAFSQSCDRFEERLGTLLEARLREVDQTITELQALRTDLAAVRQDLQSPTVRTEPCRLDDCESCRFIDD